MQPTPSSLQARPVSRRAATVVAAGALAWLAACDRTPQVTAPDPTASPLVAAVPGLTGHLDKVSLDEVLATPCTQAEDLPVLAGDGVIEHATPLAAVAGPTTTTYGGFVYDMDTPIPGAASSAVDINNSGLVAVNVKAPGGDRAYAWTQAGGFVPIAPLPGALTSFATDLNNGGTIVGYATFAGGVIKSWRWTSGGGTSEILGGPANLEVHGINDIGWLTGSSGIAPGQVAVRLDASGWKVIGPAPSAGAAINLGGAVAGWVGAGLAIRATYWAPGALVGQDLGVVATAQASRAFAINDAGRVVGETYKVLNGVPEPFAFYWGGSGPLMLIDAANFTGPPSSARDINNAGLVAGYALSVTGAGKTVFIWTPTAGPMLDLGKRIGSCSSFGYGLNDVCVVVGHNLVLPPPGLPTAAYWNIPGCNPPTGQLGNFVWIDANGNGKQDAGEPGIPGVTLTLSGPTPGTQTTNGSGGYLFTGLTLGSYTVTITPPAGFVATTPNAPGTNNTNDSNGTPTSTTITISGLSDLTLDFGFVKAAGSGQGCTPGFWKQDQHFGAWKWFQPTNSVDVVFGITFRSTLKNNPSGELTLLQGLELNGNSGSEAMIRHGVAALLNSAYQSGVSYPYTTSQIITMVRNAWLTGSFDQMETVHQSLRTANEALCPLN